MKGTQPTDDFDEARSWIARNWCLPIGILVAIVVTVIVWAICLPRCRSGLIDFLPFAANVVLAAITFWYACLTRQLAQSAEKQLSETRKAAQGEMLLKLNELYAEKRTSEAIRFIRDFGREHEMEAQSAPRGRYQLGQSFYERFPAGSKGDLLRWHLTNFWYTVAVLDEQKIVCDELVQRRFGSSLDVIDILEPIEAVLSYRLWKEDEPTTRRPWEDPKWPVWNLYTRYKRKPEQATIPADGYAFDRWRRGFEQRDPGEAS